MGESKASHCAYTLHSCDRRVYISTAREYIAESGVYIWQFTTAGIFWFLQWNGQFSPVLTKRATAGTIELPYCTHY